MRETPSRHLSLTGEAERRSYPEKTLPADRANATPFSSFRPLRRSSYCCRCSSLLLASFSSLLFSL
ncbi:hypothetical protein LINPERHAP1_LOCUS8976 [Linum perenne]